jgi:hypothetical protein
VRAAAPVLRPAATPAPTLTSPPKNASPLHVFDFSTIPKHDGDNSSNSWQNFSSQAREANPHPSSGHAVGTPPHVRKRSENIAPSTKPIAGKELVFDKIAAKQPGKESNEQRLPQGTSPREVDTIRVQRAVEDLKRAKPPAEHGSKEANDMVTVQRERRDSVMPKPEAAPAVVQHDAKTYSNEISNGHNMTWSPEITSLKNKMSQLEDENHGLKTEMRAMRLSAEAFAKSSEKHLHEVILKVKLEQLETERRVEKLYQAEEKRQLRGTSQAPYHVLVKSSESLILYASCAMTWG